MQSLFKLFSFLILSLAWTGAARADDSVLSLCNRNTDRVVYAAHMKQMGSGAGWQAVGWFKVPAGQCLDQNLKSYVGKVYLYAEDEFQESSWGEGSVRFCVKEGAAFSVNNADAVDCAAAGLKRVTSDAVSVQPGKTVWEMQPNFSKLSLCNRNAGFSVYAAFAKPVADRLNSKGWFEVPAGKCRELPLGKYSGPVSYFAKGGQFAWDGAATPFCVNSASAFDVKDADQPSSCLGAGFEMIHPREVTVQTGLTTVDLEAKTLETTLKVCNTTEKILFSSQAVAAAGGLWESSGWTELMPKACVTTNLGLYTGSVHLYAEWNKGEMYWGSGPFNFCVNRTQAFTMADSGNQALCNSDIALKMVPSFEFPLKAGSNTFNFQP